jgi:hypothetical protein
MNGCSASDSDAPPESAHLRAATSSVPVKQRPICAKPTGSGKLQSQSLCAAGASWTRPTEILSRDFCTVHWIHEPTPDPSQQGNWKHADECCSPPGRGQGWVGLHQVHGEGWRGIPQMRDFLLSAQHRAPFEEFALALDRARAPARSLTLRAKKISFARVAWWS